MWEGKWEGGRLLLVLVLLLLVVVVVIVVAVVLNCLFWCYSDERGLTDGDSGGGGNGGSVGARGSETCDTRAVGPLRYYDGRGEETRLFGEVERRGQQGEEAGRVKRVAV